MCSSPVQVSAPSLLNAKACFAAPRIHFLSHTQLLAPKANRGFVILGLRAEDPFREAENTGGYACNQKTWRSTPYLFDKAPPKLGFPGILHSFYPTVPKHAHTAAMNSATRNIAIEKNRAALMRLILCWLKIAAFFDADRVLPKRIGQWVSEMIFKAEKAAFYLQIASGYGLTSDAMPVQRYGRLTIRAVIKQLKAVKRALILLKSKTWALRDQTHHAYRNIRSRKYYSRDGAVLHLQNSVFNGRAPPPLHDAHRHLNNPSLIHPERG